MELGGELFFLQSFTNLFPVQVCSVVKSRLPRMFSPKLAVLPSGSYSWPDPKIGDPTSVVHSQETSFGLSQAKPTQK